jgi:hypothetical protein
VFNFIHFFLFLIYFSLNLVCSQQSDTGVTSDFKDMLSTPKTPSSTKENFATHVTRPFVQDSKQDSVSFLIQKHLDQHGINSIRIGAKLHTASVL